MSLIVEDGTGKADAESYISVSDASAFHSARGNTTWADLSGTQMEQALRRATDYMLQIYRQRWKGVRMTSTQALDWPRAYVYLEPVITGANQEFPNLVADDVVPTEVQRACAELAWRAASGELAPDIDPRVKREKVDVLEVEYSEYGAQYTQYRAIDNLLAPLLSSQGGAMHKVVRA